MIDAVIVLAATVGVVAACDCLAVARASFYRQRPVFGPLEFSDRELPPPVLKPLPTRTLSLEERKGVLSVLHGERFQDRSPAAIQATLLDEDRYLCSTRTM